MQGKLLLMFKFRVLSLVAKESTMCGNMFGFIGLKFVIDLLLKIIVLVLRHDSDSNVPRTRKEIYSLNQEVADLMEKTFGFNASGEPDQHYVPIVPSFGRQLMQTDIRNTFKKF
jgi:hypothetical protein